jgi:4Fe-4S ferredoxin
MFPRISESVTPALQVAGKKFLVKSVRLELDRSLCRNCGTCISACPNNVIKRGAPGASMRGIKAKTPTTQGVVLDAKACSYCGVCTVFCPFDALSLAVDGEKVPREKLQVVEKKALPQIVEELVELKDGKTGRRFMEGHLEFSKETCMSGCRVCVDICPTGALAFDTTDEGWTPENMVIDRDKCIYCGACAYACPVAAMKMFREKIRTDGEFQDPFWPDTERRLLEAKNTAHKQ